ncbi:MAG: asparagine--tRNA ligase [Chitinivibrionales bacterium]|nr:asparagine--tRNA ligase [Chitinivibrionales bacterium]
MAVFTVKQIFQAEQPPRGEIEVRGWVRTKRDSKKFSFIELNDGSCMASLQIIAESSIENYDDTVLKLTTGSSIAAVGIIVESPGKGQKYEMQAKKVTVYSIAPPDYPLQKKRHSFEYLREIAHLRPRTNTIGAVARVRSSLSHAIHTFFQDRGFVYVHTPIITASDCEGAGEMFRVTALDLDNPPKTDDGRLDYSRDFFGKQASLTVSGQLEGEIYAMALGKVYTFGPTFRAENSNTSRHLAEFWMIEPEMAFCDLYGDMDLAEEFVRYLARHALEKNHEDIAFFNVRIEKSVIETLKNIAENPFERISYTDAITILEKNNEKFEYKVTWGTDIQSEHERFLTEQEFKKPVIVYDYPKEIKSFYMKLNDDDKTVRAMDVLVPRIGELIGGSEREDRHDMLVKRINSLGLNEKDYWWYLDLRKYGGVPHAGFGLGFERLLLLVTGMQNIRDVIPFPRHPGYAEF